MSHPMEPCHEACAVHIRRQQELEHSWRHVRIWVSARLCAGDCWNRFVVKTNDATGRKVFINLCGSDKVAAPGNWVGGVIPDEVLEALDNTADLSEQQQNMLRFPLALGPAQVGAQLWVSSAGDVPASDTYRHSKSSFGGS